MKQYLHNLGKYLLSVIRYSFLLGIILSIQKLVNLIYVGFFWIGLRKDFRNIPHIIGFNYVLKNALGTYYIRHHTDDEYIVSPLFEPDLLNQFYLNRPDGIFLDIGSHIGKYSVYIANKFPESITYAFEANVSTFESLKINSSLNKSGSINHFCIGISSNSGIQEFIRMEKDTGLSRFSDTDISSLEGIKENITTASIDEIIERYNIQKDKINLIKIDVEGHEYNVLLGMKDLLSSNIEFRIIAEITNQGNDCFEFMKKYGFQYSKISDGYFLFSR